MESTFFIPEKVDFQKLRFEESQQMFDMPTLLPNTELGTTSDIVNSCHYFQWCDFCASSSNSILDVVLCGRLIYVD